MNELQDFFDLLADAINVWGDVIDSSDVSFAGIPIDFHFLLGFGFVSALIAVLLGNNDADDDLINPLKDYDGEDWD